MPSNTYRASARDRELRQMERSKPAHVRRNPRQKHLHRVKKLKGWLAALVLCPVGLITVFAVGEMIWRALTRLAFWRTDEFIFFSLGGLLWTVACLGGCWPVRYYVFGHEMSHLIVARLFGGKIIDWKVTAQGGFVETNKSNTWITLAPYLLPFYSIGVLLLFGMAGIVWDLHERHTLSLAGVALGLKGVWLFYILLGATWCFHATFTFKTIVAKQSDLERNGEFFSLLLIFLINVLLLAGLFLAASPAPGFGLVEIGRCWLGTAGWLIRLFTDW
ncbi:MAG TPA: hypothetical protein VD994_17640 [Prosthecobacter sp.]|nr:hypothetical protein [Prosthecobacter sp.]